MAPMAIRSALNAVFAYDAVTRSMKTQASAEAPRPSTENLKDMDKRFRSLMARYVLISS